MNHPYAHVRAGLLWRKKTLPRMTSAVTTMPLVLRNRKMRTAIPVLVLGRQLAASLPLPRPGSAHHAKATEPDRG